MASAAEAEVVAALFMNAQEQVPLRMCLEELGHKQPPTPLKTDNSTATGIINNTIKQKQSKAIDMQFYWLRDQVKQGQFKVYWDSGKHHHGDYTTKHHSGAHHKLMRPIRLYIKNKSPRTSQGCIRIMTQDEPKMSHALLAVHRRLGLMRGKITPHKQHSDSGFLPVTSTSSPLTTESTRDILTSYPFTKQQMPIIHKETGYKTAISNRLKSTHKFSTTIL